MFFSHRYEDISTRHHNYSIIRLIVKQMICFLGVTCPMNVHIECLKNTEARTHELIALIFVISLEREFSLFPRTSLVRDWVSRVVNYSSFPTLHRRLAKNACYWIKRELSSTKDRNDFFLRWISQVKKRVDRCLHKHTRETKSLMSWCFINLHLDDHAAWRRTPIMRGL